MFHRIQYDRCIVLNFVEKIDSHGILIALHYVSESFVEDSIW